MQLNFMLTLAISALVPLVFGFIWYHPKVFGTAWLSAGKFDAVKMKEGFNMPLVFILTYIFGFFISFVLSGIVIHQMGFFSMLQNHMKEAACQADFGNMMGKYGNDFRTFKHGMLHGGITGIGIALPVTAICGMFERKTAKHIAINAGFWFFTLMIMGGIICQFADLNSLKF
ncbi:MAG: hypothetical protein JWN78_2343 [Bacteroidota bacterium]|nr:hypothetical protein [Bacteroidota bacterium]